MKKVITLLLAALLLLTLAACAKKDTPAPVPDPAPEAEPDNTPETAPESSPENAPENVPDDTSNDADIQTMTDLFVSINDGVEIMGMSTDPITEDMWTSYLFIDPIEGAKAVVSQSMVGSIAHCALLVKVPEGTDAQGVADDIKTNANPRKWVCVEAESVQTAVRGDLVFFVMSDTATADKMVENFNALELA